MDRYRRKEGDKHGEIERINERILSERRKRREEARPYPSNGFRDHGSRGVQDPPASRDRRPQGQRYGNRGKGQFGPCLWCSQMGHEYKFCSKFEADLSTGNAKFNVYTRKWEYVSNPTTTAIVPAGSGGQ